MNSQGAGKVRYIRSMGKNLEALGAAIRAQREQRGLSLPQAARAVEAQGGQAIHYSTIEKWEKGQHKPTAGPLIALAKALGVTMAQQATWLMWAGHQDSRGRWIGQGGDDADEDWETLTRRGLYRGGIPEDDIEALIRFARGTRHAGAARDE